MLPSLRLRVISARPLAQTLPTDHLSRATRALASFGGPSPPRLPDAEQARFEELQRLSRGAFSTPAEQTATTDSSSSSGPNSSQSLSSTVSSASEPDIPDPSKPNQSPQMQARGDGEELHPDVRRGAAPEFEGDRNPRTGELGGPKNEPLRWGSDKDWSFNGRVTDF